MAEDPIAVREYFLEITNDGDAYRRQTSPIIDNLARKKAKGTYDAALAAKAYRNLVDAEIRRRARENGWDSRLFVGSDRDELARELRDYYNEQVDYRVRQITAERETRRE
jgi:hypothetical protein